MAKTRKQKPIPQPVVKEPETTVILGLMTPWSDYAPPNSLIAAYQVGRSVNRLHFHMQANALLADHKDAIVDEICDGLISLSVLIPSEMSRGDIVARDIRQARECWLKHTFTQRDYNQLVSDAYDEIPDADLPLHEIRDKWTRLFCINPCVLQVSDAFAHEMSDQQNACYSLGFYFDTGLYPKDLCECVDRPVDGDVPGQTIGLPFEGARGKAWFPLGDYLPAIAEIRPQPEWRTQMTQCLKNVGVSADLTQRIHEFVHATRIERLHIAADIDETIRTHLAETGDQSSSPGPVCPHETRKQIEANTTAVLHTALDAHKFTRVHWELLQAMLELGAIDFEELKSCPVIVRKALGQAASGANYKRYLTTLKSQGFIESHEAGRAGGYFLTPQGKARTESYLEKRSLRLKTQDECTPEKADHGIGNC